MGGREGKGERRGKGRERMEGETDEQGKREGRGGEGPRCFLDKSNPGHAVDRCAQHSGLLLHASLATIE